MSVNLKESIHYCWFGGKQKDNTVKKCIASWHKFCPDYEFIEWTENNFDVSENPFAEEAYAAKKWAFVSDYVRLKVLHEYGGVYCDADVEILRNINELLEHNAFSGFQNFNEIPTGIMGAKKGNKWIEYLLLYYNNRHFLINGNFDMQTNVKIITEMTKRKYNIRLNNSRQLFDDNCLLLPQDYLCAKNPYDGKVTITSNTFAVHHFNGSWVDEKMKNKIKIYRFLNRYVRNKKIYKICAKIYRCFIPRI